MTLTVLFSWFNSDKEKAFGKELTEYFLGEMRSESCPAGLKYKISSKLYLRS